MRCKAALGLEGGLQPVENTVEGGGDGGDFSRQVARRHGGEIAPAARRELRPEAPQWREAGPDRQHDEGDGDGNDQQQRQPEGEDHLAKHGGAVAHRLGHRDAHRALQRLLVVDAEALRLAEARAVIGRKDAGFGQVRLQQDAPGGIAHHIGEVLVALAERAQALAGAVILALDDVHDGERQQALRGFLQG